jgi:hypothetical protein
VLDIATSSKLQPGSCYQLPDISQIRKPYDGRTCQAQPFFDANEQTHFIEPQYGLNRVLPPAAPPPAMYMLQPESDVTMATSGITPQVIRMLPSICQRNE